MLTMEKYIGRDQVLDTKTKGQPSGEILVKLRAPGGVPRWERMRLDIYRKRSRLVPKRTQPITPR